MSNRGTLSLILAAGVISLTPAAAPAAQITLDAGATVVSPQFISADNAARVLLNQATGVLTISIPGGGAGAGMAGGQPAGTAPSTVFAFSNVVQDGQRFVISGSGQNAAVLDQLIAQLGGGESVSSFRAIVAGTSATGYIDSAGFQLIVVEVVKNDDGSGYLRAIVPFD
jgi:hypothetical protein